MIIFKFIITTVLEQIFNSLRFMSEILALLYKS
ncbi:hypothetical protein EGX64_01600 [Staphylococcus epidermidis]|nr:hypothetical protein EGX64_01600 [Staphylococcus epidermidis]KAA9392490.1 hypothetical protein F6I16_01935 [Staphylococcus epidermidis]KAB2224626.1 hypothetical protein F9B46_09855 [Staphylococcus epidermidis]MBB1177407.1 hypothetical protein [Staphylococcus epidermidis]MBM0802242.1 hypothetical protein [Staphylococcus epidermidis]